MNSPETMPDRTIITLSVESKTIFDIFQLCNLANKNKQDWFPPTLLNLIGIYLQDMHLAQWNRFEHIQQADKIVDELTTPRYLSETDKQAYKTSIRNYLLKNEVANAKRAAVTRVQDLLEKSAISGDKEVMQKIIKTMPDVDLNEETFFSTTPLIAAVSGSHVACVEFLIKQPTVLINKKSRGGMALNHALEKKKQNLQIIIALLGANAVNASMMHDGDYAKIVEQSPDQTVRDVLEKAADRVRTEFIESAVKYMRSLPETFPELPAMVESNNEKPVKQRLKNTVNFAIESMKIKRCEKDDYKTFLKNALKIEKNDSAIIFSVEYGCAPLMKHLMESFSVWENSMRWGQGYDNNIYAFEFKLRTSEYTEGHTDRLEAKYPLEALSYYGHADCVALMLKQKDEWKVFWDQFAHVPDAKESVINAFRFSIIKGHMDVFQLFMKDKDLRAVGLEKPSELQIFIDDAVKHGRQDMALLLRAQMPQPPVKDIAGPSRPMAPEVPEAEPMPEIDEEPFSYQRPSKKKNRKKR